ncbi:hypothetical protein Droror1_Dr00021941 [Drosera rotundifolia]
MLAAAAAVRSPLHHNSHQQLRFFARWVPYKPQQKPKHHRKLLTLKTLKSQLESSIFISPFTCHGFSAPQFKSLKHPLPKPTSKLIVTKNSLALRAFKGTQWEKLGDCMKGMNALLFVSGDDEEAAAEAVRGVRGVVREGKLEFNGFSGGVLRGGERAYGGLDLEVLEGLPGREVSDGLLLGTVMGPGASLIALLQGFGVDGGNGEEGKVGGEETKGGGEEKGDK